MAQRTLLIAAYRAMRPEEREHWAFFIKVTEFGTEVHGLALQLCGRPGMFWFSAGHAVLNRAQSLRETIEVGQVDDGDIDRVIELLKTVPIKVAEDDDAWDCQSWVLDALAPLTDAGYVDSGKTREKVQARLDIAGGAATPVKKEEDDS